MLEVPVDPFEFGGQRYELRGGAVDARLDISHTVSGYAFRLRFDAGARGPVRALPRDRRPGDGRRRPRDRPARRRRRPQLALLRRGRARRARLGARRAGARAADPDRLPRGLRGPLLGVRREPEPRRPSTSTSASPTRAGPRCANSSSTSGWSRFASRSPEAELDDLRAASRTRLAGPSARRSTTGRRASRSPTCRSSARYWARRLRLAGHRGAAERAPAVPHGDRRARYPLPPRPLAAPRRAAARDHARLARSIVEFLKVIGPLTDPTAHGGETADAFHVVCPSLPGYGFSDKPAAPGWGVERIAAAWIELMGRLGYERYGAQGSDWGTSVTRVHRPAGPRARGGDPPQRRRSRRQTRRRSTTSPSRARRARVARARRRMGVRLLDASTSTRPQTIGYALVDSPAGARAPGSSRSSGPGPTATATSRTC